MRATCCWGEGIDVLLVNDGNFYMLYDEPSHKDRCTHGISKEGSIELTRTQARKLANSLMKAADYCDELDKSYKDYIEEEQRRRSEFCYGDDKNL